MASQVSSGEPNKDSLRERSQGNNAASCASDRSYLTARLCVKPPERQCLCGSGFGDFENEHRFYTHIPSPGVDKMSVSANAVPAPFSLTPAWVWAGDDGSWSTFRIEVGTPAQAFNILPSTTGSEVWLPNTIGCEGVLINIANCGFLRGVEQGRGWESNASSTYDVLGLYELSTEQNLWGPTGNPGVYGLDTVSLPSYPSGDIIDLKSQTVAGVATANVWVGSLGLGIADAGFDTVQKNGTPSLLVSMKEQNYTPSLSFGYAAGASYCTSFQPLTRQHIG